MRTSSRSDSSSASLTSGIDLEAAVAERLDALGQRVDDGAGHREELDPEDLLVRDGVADRGCRAPVRMTGAS